MQIQVSVIFSNVLGEYLTNDISSFLDNGKTAGFILQKEESDQLIRSLPM